MKCCVDFSRPPETAMSLRFGSVELGFSTISNFAPRPKCKDEECLHQDISVQSITSALAQRRYAQNVTEQRTVWKVSASRFIQSVVFLLPRPQRAKSAEGGGVTSRSGNPVTATGYAALRQPMHRNESAKAAGVADAVQPS